MNRTVKKIFLGVLLFVPSLLHSQSRFAAWTGTELRLSNGVVERIIQLPAVSGNFLTTSYRPLQGAFNYFQKNNTDFQFELNGKIYSGRSRWKLVLIENFSDGYGGEGARVTLQSEENSFQLSIQFLLYPGLAVIRKNLSIKNLTKQSVSLESVDIEKFEVTGYLPTTFSVIAHDYGRRTSIGPYEGNAQDALVVVDNREWKQGIVVGNEAPGVVKRTAVFWEEATISAGLTHSSGRYPFRKWISPDQSFDTPQVFTIVYNEHQPYEEVFNKHLPDFIRNHIGSRLSQLKQKPTFVYNTWVPFKTQINESLIMELAKSAADAGMKEFVIDDGWESNFGDWEIDRKKFPNGLKPVFDYIKSLGMKPGLWVSVGSASPSSNVYKLHPEWFVEDKNNRPTNLHIEDSTIRTACFGTGWYGYIKGVLEKLTVEYGLEYLKLDFTVVTSPYRFSALESGCYAKAHEGHRDHHESLFTNYEKVWSLFDELHKVKPELFIDCTFETMGGLQLIDYAMIKHAEGNWLSNFKGPDEKIDLRIRNMAWWRSPAMPATALVIGNPEMQDKGWERHIQSLAGALPIMLGDPRKLSTADFKKYRQYADWLQQMEVRHGIMSYRQDLSGFGEPMEGNWDGFQRINTSSLSGGIVGVFRHGSSESKRVVTVRYVDPDKTYVVREALSGLELARMRGLQLSKVGFPVSIDEPHAGLLFEIVAEQ